MTVVGALKRRFVATLYTLARSAIFMRLAETVVPSARNASAAMRRRPTGLLTPRLALTNVPAARPAELRAMNGMLSVHSHTWIVVVVVDVLVVVVNVVVGGVSSSTDAVSAAVTSGTPARSPPSDVTGLAVTVAVLTTSALMVVW